MTIDAHQHFWKYNPIRDRWITDEMSAIRQDFLPGQLAPILKENKIEGCVSVQADQSEEETEFLIGLAKQNSFIKGVVGWVDLCSEKINERLYYFSAFKILKGFRHVVQAEPDGFLNRKEFLFGIQQLQQHNFTYDVLIYPHQLDEAIEFVAQFPNQKFVIDHLAKPNIKQNSFDSWSNGMAEIASHENVYCKLSGMVAEADWKNWKQEDFLPYLDFVIEKFGIHRVMYGSDWPVCLVAAAYQQQLSLIGNYISKLSRNEKDLIMGGNAIRFYNL